MISYLHKHEIQICQNNFHRFDGGKLSFGFQYA